MNADEDWDGKHQKQLQQTDKNTETNTQQKYSSQIHDKRQTQAQNPQTTRYHKTLSPPGHNPLMCWTDVQKKYV